jgi:hypothetical protein
VNKLPRAAGFALLLLSSAALALGLGGGEKKREPQRAGESGNPPAGPAAGDAGIRGPAPEDTEMPNLQVRVSGRVRLVGGGPFPQLVISGEDREWYIDREEESKLLDLQQRIVTVEGTESYTDLTFANGFPAGRRYTLKNIKVTGNR